MFTIFVCLENKKNLRFDFEKNKCLHFLNQIIHLVDFVRLAMAMIRQSIDKSINLLGPRALTIFN